MQINAFNSENYKKVGSVEYAVAFSFKRIFSLLLSAEGFASLISRVHGTIFLAALSGGAFIYPAARIVRF